MNWIDWLHAFFTDPALQSGPDAIPHRIAEHLAYTVESLAWATLLAVPLGLLLGYLGRGAVLATVLTGTARALPTLGLVTLVVLLAGVGKASTVIPLVVLAIPPLLVGAVEGVRGTDPQLRDAARGIGLTHPQVLRQVCFPAALPSLLAGLRTATIQVIATATVAAYVGMGGLGRYVIDGLALRKYYVVAGGAVLVVALALAAQLFFALLIRYALPPGSRPVRRGTVRKGAVRLRRSTG
ncbi:ABC transporter permease [Kitasatospora sp. NPDC096147]|uniref:ABC transporter permease n=1 Tax=Kitasatospora sp. NPDC096147 TaxID=3364093 RepID=UPI003813BADA